MNTSAIIALVGTAISKLFEALFEAGATPEQIKQISLNEVKRIEDAEEKSNREEWDTVNGIKTQDLP